MSIIDVIRNGGLLSVRQRGRLRIAHNILKVGGRDIRVLGGVSGAAEGAEVGVVEDIAGRDAVAAADAIEGRAPAGRDGDGALHERAVLQPAEVTRLAEGVEGLDDGVESAGVAGLEVDEQDDRLVGPRLVDGAPVVVDDGFQGVHVLRPQRPAERRQDVPDDHVALVEPDVGLDADAAGGQGPEERHVAVVVVVAVAGDREDAVQRVQGPRVQRGSGAFVDALRRQHGRREELVQRILLGRNPVSERVVTDAVGPDLVRSALRVAVRGAIARAGGCGKGSEIRLARGSCFSYECLYVMVTGSGELTIDGVRRAQFVMDLN